MQYQDVIFQKLQNYLPDYKTFEARIITNIQDSYFPFVYQSIYMQLGYTNLSTPRFNIMQFKHILKYNNFLLLVNDIYRTRVSTAGLIELTNRLLDLDSFDNYQLVIQKFEACDPVIYKGKQINRNAFSLGTKIMHFYNPETNPILDSIVRDNLNLGDMDYVTCIEFNKAMNSFATCYSDYFKRLIRSENVLQLLNDRGMTSQFQECRYSIWRYIN
ncbi:MAG: hypothetical protein WC346_13150 [Methanogenium sp.]|jgi:hypothetical protein